MSNYRNAAVLVVDDSATIRKIITSMVRHIGFAHVEEADSGEAAFAKLRGRHFALIISDWNMEPMDGLQLLRSVRSLQTYNRNRFIFLTTERSWGHRTTARLDGADEFLTKPFTADQLRSKIDRVMATALKGDRQTHAAAALR